ncbi:hypothetical protein ACFQ2B_03700 [Streptomyces stramineus]|uniref:Uncharacterized protein n=1 Tax=Streptomyces stramineus TaxID=173861 RepID=A0ABP3K6I3_9ACTN
MSGADQGVGGWLSQGLLFPSGRQAWKQGQPVQALTGHLFDAVQIAASAVENLAGEPGDQGAQRAFRERGVHSAVIADPLGWYYALVPPGTAEGWDGDALCIGSSHSIAVPAPHRTDPPGVHWLLPPPEGERMLCDAYAVWQLTASEDERQ